MRHGVRRTFGQNGVGAFIAYAVMDVLCVGLGMGIPVFNILLGLPAGWFGARRAELYSSRVRTAMRRALRYSLQTSLVTMALMIGIWGRLLWLVSNPRVDVGSIGLPLNLYDTKLTIISWVVMMVFAGPFLQFLSTVSGAYFTVMARLKDQRFPEPAE